MKFGRFLELGVFAGFLRRVMRLDEGFIFCSWVPFGVAPAAEIPCSAPGSCVQPRELIRGAELHKPEMLSVWVSPWSAGSRSVGLRVMCSICPLLAIGGISLYLIPFSIQQTFCISHCG